MKFTVDAETFAQRAAIAAEAASTRDLRFLGMKLDTRTRAHDGMGGMVVLTCRDEGREARIECPAEVEKAGTALIPARLLARVAAASSEGDLHVDGDEPAGVLLSTAADRWVLHRLSTALPAVDVSSPSATAGFDIGLAREVRRVVAPCVAAPDSAQQGLRYMHLTIREDGTTSWAATDTYRMAIIEQKSKAKSLVAMLMPAAPLQAAARHAPDDAVLTVGAAPKSAMVSFDFEDGATSANRVTGGAAQYPDWRKISRRRDLSVTVETSPAEMLAAIEKATIVVGSAHPSLRVDFGKNEMTLRGHDSELGDARAKVACDVSAAAVGQTTHFSSAFLRHLLKSCPQESICLRTEPTPQGELTELWEARFELMPDVEAAMLLMAQRTQ